MEYFLIKPSSPLRFGCVTKHKSNFEDENGKFTKGIYEMLECNGIEHMRLPYNDKGIVGGFIVDDTFMMYPNNSVFGYKYGVDKDENIYYKMIGGKSLFYCESDHSEEEVYEFLKSILYFPKDEIENTIMYDDMKRFSQYIVFKPNSIHPQPHIPLSFEELLKQKQLQSEFI